MFPHMTSAPAYLSWSQKYALCLDHWTFLFCPEIGIIQPDWHSRFSSLDLDRSLGWNRVCQRWGAADRGSKLWLTLMVHGSWFTFVCPDSIPKGSSGKKMAHLHLLTQGKFTDDLAKSNSQEKFTDEVHKSICTTKLTQVNLRCTC